MIENPLTGKKSCMEFQVDGFFFFPQTKLIFSITDTKTVIDIVHDTAIADFARKLSGVIALSLVASLLLTLSWIDQTCFQKQ